MGDILTSVVRVLIDLVFSVRITHFDPSPPRPSLSLMLHRWATSSPVYPAGTVTLSTSIVISFRCACPSAPSSSPSPNGNRCVGYGLVQVGRGARHHCPSSVVALPPKSPGLVDEWSHMLSPQCFSLLFLDVEVLRLSRALAPLRQRHEVRPLCCPVAMG